MNQLSAVLSGSLREGRDKFSQGRYLMEKGKKSSEMLLLMKEPVSHWKMSWLRHLLHTDGHRFGLKIS